MTESKEVALKDASLIISWDEAVSRAIRQEQFISNYPNSARIDDIKQLFGGYVYVTFNGVDNTPLFRYEDDKLDPDAKKAYEMAIGIGSDKSAYLERLAELLQLIDKSEGKLSDEIINYQEETLELWGNTFS